MVRNKLQKNVNKKYSIIYADPAWKYRDKRKGMGGAEDHYETMTTKEICDLPVGNICQKNSILFMWMTWPTLFDAKAVMDAWGFTYKTAGFLWVKTCLDATMIWLPDVMGTVVGPGNYTLSNTEPCLVGVRGKGLKRKDKSVRQLLMAPRTGHSAKPAEARRRIELLYGGVNRVELFARNPSKGWDVWGNEVDSTIEL